jgi:hypothetical protein
MTKDDIAQGRKCSFIISDCERRANIHGSLRSGGFLACFGLLKKMNGNFVTVVRYEIRSFFETDPAKSATLVSTNEFRVSATKSAFDVRLANLSSALARVAQLRNPPAV